MIGKRTRGIKRLGRPLYVVCGIKEKDGKHDRMDNMEAKNLPDGR